MFVFFCGDGDGNHFECEFSPAKRGSDLWGERYDNYQTKNEEVGEVFWQMSLEGIKDHFCCERTVKGSLHPKKPTWTQKWRFGRWCSFSKGWFSGSMLVSRGVGDCWDIKDIQTIQVSFEIGDWQRSKDLDWLVTNGWIPPQNDGVWKRYSNSL